MSYVHTELVRDYYHGQYKLLALIVASYANHHTGRIRVGYDRLAEVSDVSRRTAIRQMDALVRMRLFLPMRSRGGRGMANEWAFNMDYFATGKGDTAMSPFPDQNSDTAMSPFPTKQCQPEPERVSSSAQKGDISGQKGDTAMSPLSKNLNSIGRESDARVRASPRESFSENENSKNPNSEPQPPNPTRQSDTDPEVETPESEAARKQAIEDIFSILGRNKRMP